MHGYGPMAKKRKRSFQINGAESLHHAKANQAAKLQELGDILAKEGFVTVSEQSKVLGLSRSTSWTILKGSHKGSGLSARVINRILGQRLPPAVRTKIVEYVEEKAGGCYGHSRLVRRRFIAQLSATKVDRSHLFEIAQNEAA